MYFTKEGILNLRSFLVKWFNNIVSYQNAKKYSLIKVTLLQNFKSW